MRWFLAALLVVHGLIHLVGLARPFGLARLPQLRGLTTIVVPDGLQRPVGVLWLMACLLLVAAAVLVVVRVEGWWTVALAGAVLSQGLVVLAWPEARFGTLANVIVLVAVVLQGADLRFQRDTAGAVDDLLSSVSSSPLPVVTAADLASLPPPVARWLQTAGVVGKPRVRTVWLRQRGGLRTSAGQALMPADAEQVFTVDPPGFVWSVRVTMKHVIPIVGRDQYRDGRGHMRIAAAGLIPVVDAGGAAIDQGTLLRYLGEMVWFPSAALGPTLGWQPVDDHSARATLTYRGVSASALFTFADDGRFLGLSARRYMDAGGDQDATLQPWTVRATAWRAMDGVVVPVEGSVLWQLASGDFEYYRWQITDLEYDGPRLRR
jgi:hypothetical protein